MIGVSVVIQNPQTKRILLFKQSDTSSKSRWEFYKVSIQDEKELEKTVLKELLNTLNLQCRKVEPLGKIHYQGKDLRLVLCSIPLQECCKLVDDRYNHLAWVGAEEYQYYPLICSDQKLIEQCEFKTLFSFNA